VAPTNPSTVCGPGVNEYVAAPFTAPSDTPDATAPTTRPATFELIRANNAPVPAPAAPDTAPTAASTPTFPQSTEPDSDFCDATDIPAATIPPPAATNKSPTGPPTPLHIATTPTATKAAAKR
ncbi:hypothetical protein C5D47_10730, partial [Rathayibacter toxicus]